ncbi:MAG: hypothetical protein AAGD00_06665 [Planctomycetota bacterium]
MRFAALLLVVVLAHGATASPPALPDLAERLAALEPSVPAAYFELAEELAYEAINAREERVARELFVLAAVLADDSESGDQIARGACLALASMSNEPSEARWLRAMAAIRTAGADASAVMPNREDSEANARASLVLAAYRAERHRDARKLLADPATRAALEKHRAELPRYSSMLEAIEAGALPADCRGERVVRAGDADQPFVLCPTCRGNPGARLSGRELRAMLRTEAILLDAPAGSWSTQLTVDGGAPLPEVDIRQLAVRFDIDPNATRWRAGSRNDPLAGSWEPR